MSASPKVQTKFDKDLTGAGIFLESPSKQSSSNDKTNKVSEDSVNGKNEEHKNAETSVTTKNEEEEDEMLKAEEEAARVLAELSYKSQFHEVEKNIPHGLTFDDVLMIPQCSRVNSRHDISMETRFSKNVLLRIPFVSSPMETVTEYDIAVAMARMGGLGIIHRFMTIEEQAKMVEKLNFFLIMLM